MSDLAKDCDNKLTSSHSEDKRNITIESLIAAFTSKEINWIKDPERVGQKLIFSLVESSDY